MESSSLSSPTPAKRPCFIEEDDGLASLSGREDGGFSGHRHRLFCRPLSSSSSSSTAAAAPRSRRFEQRQQQRQTHFLAECFLCNKPLPRNKDIFMYRGDTPFCSEECRKEQIETDEAKENKWNLSSSMKALRKNQKTSQPTSPSKYPVQPGALAAA